MNNTELIEKILSQIRQPLWENWYIQEKIGSGAYSAVYRVTAERIQRTDVSALKIEPLVPGENTLGDEERMRRSVEEKRELCVNESTIMYELRNCPYIVAYEDEDIRELVVDGKFEGYYFLIRMEYLDCLTDLLKAKKFEASEKNIAALAHDIGSGIKAAHDIGVIHRDVKPANFFVNAKGVYKLGDFNISKQTVSCDTFAGTNSYIAPEVRFAKAGAGDSYTCQADIYSFGICLYQLMNGLYLPFEDTMPLKEAVDRRMSGEALPAPKNASPEFAKVILKACAHSTEERYKTIDEFLADLAAMYAPAPAEQPYKAPEYQKPEAPQDPYLDPTAYPVPKKNPAVIIAVILVILAVIGGVAAFLFFSGGDDGSTGNKTAPTEELIPITEMELNTEGLYIGVFEDVEITTLNCPDTLSMSMKEELPTDLFSYSYYATLYARSDELVITVNDDATETLRCDAPTGVDVSAVLEDGKYNISIDVGEACEALRKGDDADYRVVFTNGDESIEEAVEIKVELVGPFAEDGLKFTSSDDRVIEFTEDTYYLRGEGEALVNIIYDGEVVYSKKVTVTE